VEIFKRERTSDDDERSGEPSTVILKQIDQRIRENRRIITNKITYEMNIRCNKLLNFQPKH